MAYSILEANMEKLEKKLTRIQNKCKRFGCSFTYEKVGEEFKTLKDERGVEYKAKFILIEAEGKAVLNDWVFVASVQHTEKGNIINSTGCSIECCPSRSLGIAASLFPTWNRELAYQKKQEEKKVADSVSKHVGEIGQRISFKIANAVALTSWETEWGYTTLWKIIDESGNVFTWKTSSCPDFEHAGKIIGTIKAHNEFRDCKQTELTRCKLAA